MLRKLIGIAFYGSASADNKYSTYRLSSVKFLELFSNKLRFFIYLRRYKIQYIFFGHLLRESHYILIFNNIFIRDTAFNLFGSIKINQIIFCDDLCHGIARNGDHAVSNHASVSGYTDIACSRANIHKSDIEHTVILRDSYGYCGNRLESHIYNTKPCQLNRSVQAVHHIIRQKCGYHVTSDGMSFMLFYRAYLITVHIVSDNRITYAVELKLRIIIVLKLLIRLLYTHSVKSGNILSGNQLLAFKLKRNRGLFRPEYTTCGCDAYIL